MTTITSREQRRQLERDNAKQPAILTEVPRCLWPDDSWMDPKPTRIWRSRKYLVVEYPAKPPAVARLSVQTTIIVGEDWADGLRWDQLQQIKREIGFGNCVAVEIYPPDSEIVNVANMRHLWVLADMPAFAWRKP